MSKEYHITLPIFSIKTNCINPHLLPLKTHLSLIVLNFSNFFLSPKPKNKNNKNGISSRLLRSTPP